jgi:glutaredoxin 3
MSFLRRRGQGLNLPGRTDFKPVGHSRPKDPIHSASIMPKIQIYTTLLCPYCVRAKQLLQRKGVDYEEIRIDLDHEQMRLMLQRSRRQTVPQIFIDDYHVGGYDDLAAMDARGELDPRLSL